MTISRKAKNRRPHSDACRRRLEALIKDTDKVKAADERKTEALAKMLEKADEERKAKRVKGNGVEPKPEDQDMMSVEPDKNEQERKEKEDDQEMRAQPGFGRWAWLAPKSRFGVIGPDG